MEPKLHRGDEAGGKLFRKRVVEDKRTINRPKHTLLEKCRLGVG